jgi:hypothetical protein
MASRVTSIVISKFLHCKILVTISAKSFFQQNFNLTPKGVNVRTADKPVLGSVTKSHTIFRFLKTFFEDAPRSKLCGSTKIVFFGHTDQKLWMFEVFRRSLGRVGMCWNQ